MGYRIAVDTGGTFSDVVLSDDAEEFSLSKAPDHAGTASTRASRSALGFVAEERWLGLEELLARTRTC